MAFQVEVGGSRQPSKATFLARKSGEAAQTLTKTSGVLLLGKVRFVVDCESENEKDVMQVLTELVVKGKILLGDVHIKHF